MEASSFDSEQGEFNVNNASLNETANSIHFQYGQKDKDMLEINDILRNFIEEKLDVKTDFAFGGLEQNPCVAGIKHQIIKPIPNVYFLPTTLLFTSLGTDIEKFKNSLEDLQHKDYQIRFNRDKKQVNLVIHNKLQMLFYNLRAIKTEVTLHRDPKMLDSKYLIDKLFQYYSKFYSKLYFRQTSILLLFWAYQHELLQHTISEQALKLLIICNFINFGYGVNNICHVEASNKEKMQINKKMNSFLRITPRGQSQVLEGLTAQFFNYTIQEKRGFYLVSKKKFMQIKDIVPIVFPLIPVSEEEQQKLSTSISQAIKGPIEHTTEMMSICKNISKIFRYLHNKFQKPMRLVIDFGEHSAYRSEFSSTFEMQVLHPVLNTSLCKLKDGEVKHLKRQINHIHERFVKNDEPLQIITLMMEKARR